MDTLKHPTRHFLLGFFLTVFTCNAACGQAAYVGQYIGQAKIAFSGTLTQPPASAGLVSFTVRTDGTVAEIGGKLIGTVNSGGAITWQTPNPQNFTTGTISGNILTSSSSETNGGLTIIRSVEGKLAGAQFPAGESFTDRITDLNPTNGFEGQTRIKFLDGKFVAVGNAGSIVTSDDGQIWERFAAPTAQELTSISLENGLYLVTGSAGALFTSPDLVTWTKRTSPFPSFLDIIDGASGNGKFLITSNLGKGATSPDGITWTEVAASAGTFEKVDFLNGQFVKYYKSNLSFSTDGITWSAEVNPGAGIIHDVAYGGGNYVAGGGTGLAVSPNGTTWTLTRSGNTDEVAYGGGRFVARNVGTGGTAYHSADGTTWVQAALSPKNNSHDLAYGSGRFVFAGSGFQTSTNGEKWAGVLVERLALDYLVFRRFGSTDQPIFRRTIQTAGNGETSLMSVNEYSPETTSGTPILWVGDGGKVFIEQGTQKEYVDIGSDTDLFSLSQHPITDKAGPLVAGAGGRMWELKATGATNNKVFTATELTTPVTATLRSSAIVSGGSIFVGDGGTILKTVLIVTNSGSTQSISYEFAQEASGTTANLRFALDFSSSETVVVGDNGTILVRPFSGGAWSSRTSGTTENLVGITQIRDGFNNQPIYVIVGENGGTLTSTDLITWTAGQQLNPPGKINTLRLTTSIAGYASGDSGYYAVASYSSGVVNFTEFGVTGDRFTPATAARSITHGAGKFVVAGGNFSASSRDGKSWESSQIPQLANDVAYGGGKFVAVGGNAGDISKTNRIHYSSDGLDWKKAIMPSLARPLRAVTYGSGKFIASGHYGVVMSSEDGITWTQVGGDLGTFSNNIVDMVHANGTFVGVGGGLFITSTDSGTTFTAGGFSVAGFVSVTWGAGTFVAVGSDGNTVRSTNGTSWTRTQIQASQSATGSRPVFNQVAYANDSFIATTASGQAYVSSDGGVSWQEKFTGLNKNFTGSTVGNGLAVFIGGGNIVGIAVEDNSPYVTTQPQPTTLNAGTPLNLSVTVSGNNPLTYQWFQNGAPLANGGSVSGANGATLTINNITPDFSGTYQVTVTNPDGSRTSTEATVTVEGSAVVGYDAWKGNFTFPPGKDGPLDDADDDGVLNLLEFVTGSHPVQPGPSLLPGVGKLTGTQIGGSANPAKNYLTFQARVRKDRPGITLIPQSGNTLADLTGPNASSLVEQVGEPMDDPGDPEFELITYYHTVAIEDSTTGTAFMRIGVSL